MIQATAPARQPNTPTVQILTMQMRRSDPAREWTPSVASLDRKQWDALTLWLAFIGILIGVMDSFSNVGVWMLGQAFGSSLTPSSSVRLGAVGYWLAGLALVSFAFIRGRAYILQLFEPAKAPADDIAKRSDREETHVYDYSSLLRDVESDHGKSLPVMRVLRDNMINISDPLITSPCAMFSTFHETPSSGVERIKYSLDSGENVPGLSYVLHVEFDRRLSDEAKERLLDIRLVVRRSTLVDLDVDKIDEGSHEIMANCVRMLLFPSGPKEDVKAFCRERFGWEPLLAQGS